MKTIQIAAVFLVLICLCSLPAVAASGSYSAETKALLSTLQSMGHGYHAQADWNNLLRQIDDLEARAQQDRDWDTVVNVNVIEAKVYSDMLGDHQKALSILREAKRSYRDQAVPSLRKVYVTEAEVYAKLGNEAAINDLIKEFKSGPLYDPEKYSYWGGEGRDVPLTVVRPGERGDNSLTVTAMETFRTQARSARGSPFPDFQGVDLDGKSIGLNDLRGKVVLVDFWLPNWEPWKREVSNKVQLYQSYHAKGFEIIGISLEPAATSKEFLRAYSMTWPQVTTDSGLPKKLGIFGDVTSFLLDQNGQIVGRDLKGSELTDAVKRTLGVQ